MVDVPVGIYEQIQEPTRNVKVLVSTTSKVISEARNILNPRKVIVIRNISAAAVDIITINLGPNVAVASNGIVLNQNDAFVDSTEVGYQAYQGGITGICATVNGILSIFER